MSLLDKNHEIECPHNIYFVYGTLINIANSIEGMSLESADKRSFSVKMICGATLWSWGETVTVVCRYIDEDHTSVHIKSEPKVKMAPVDLGKGKRNIQQIVDALNKALSSKPSDKEASPTAPPRPTPQSTPQSNPEPKQAPLNKHVDPDPTRLPKLTLTTDTDCVFYIGGIKQLQLVKGLAQEFPLRPGIYSLTFNSLDNQNDSLQVEFEMFNEDAVYEVSLNKGTVKDNAGEKKKSGGKIIEVIRKRQEAQRAKMVEEQRKMAEVIRKLSEETQRQNREQS